MSTPADLDRLRAEVLARHARVLRTVADIERRLSPAQIRHRARRALIGRMQHMMNQAGDTVGHAADTTRQAAGALTERVRSNPLPYAFVGLGVGLAWLLTSQRTRQQITRDNPLMFGLLALTAGALVGSVLPMTEIEHEYMGEARERVLRSARSMAEQKAQRFASGQ